MSSPRVSVVLPVYNGADYVREAVQSLLAQTFADFEIIAIDDGSKDDSAEVLHSIRDSRLQVVRQENRGLAKTLNRGVALARGEYVARQDHDDVSMPERFARQVAFLDAHPDYALLGTRAEIHAGGRFTGRVHDHPLSHEALCFELLFDNPFVHSSVMLRRSALEDVGEYCADRERQPEDFELWSRIVRRYRVANLRERLVLYRETQGSITRAVPQSFQERLVRQSAENLACFFEQRTPSREVRDVAALMHGALALLSPEAKLGRLLDLLDEAADRCDSEGDNEELRRRLEARRTFLRKQYRLRSPLFRRLAEARHWLGQRMRS